MSPGRADCPTREIPAVGPKPNAVRKKEYSAALVFSPAAGIANATQGRGAWNTSGLC